MFCHQCGRPVFTEANFCSNCGAAVHSNVFAASALNTIYRSRFPRMIAGICAGFARRYGWDLAITRVIMVVLGIVIFPVMEIAYLAGWILIPEEIPLPPPPQPAESQPSQ